MDKWSGALTKENSAVLIDAIWLVTAGLPCVLTETVEGVVEPTLIIPTLWLTQVLETETGKRENYEDGFGGVIVHTSAGQYTYPKFGFSDARVSTHVEVTQAKIVFSFWNKTGKRVVHTYTIHK